MNEKKKIVLVVDDGGLPCDDGTCGGNRIGFDAYKRVLHLAQKHQIAIPIGVTAGFLDINGVAKDSIINEDAERIISFLKENADSLPVWNHGLTHSYRGRPTEFFLYDTREKIPESVQRENLQSSQAIFESLGLARPSVFIPPGHAWEPGVTDRIAKEVGFGAIAVREFEKKPLKQWLLSPHRPYKKVWHKSEHLETLWRLGLGIPSRKRKLTGFDVWKSFEYIRPSNKLVSYAVYRSWSAPHRPHHFFAHIQNFCDVESIKLWDRIIKRLMLISVEEQL